MAQYNDIVWYEGVNGTAKDRLWAGRANGDVIHYEICLTGAADTVFHDQKLADWRINFDDKIEVFTTDEAETVSNPSIADPVLMEQCLENGCATNPFSRKFQL